MSRVLNITNDRAFVPDPVRPSPRAPRALAVTNDQDFVPDDAPPTAAPTPEKPSGLTSLLRGAKQGMTVGFGDEAAGALQGAFSYLKGGSFTDEYRKGRDEARAADAAAKEAHPWLYGGGEVGGGIAGAFLPGMAAARGVKGAMALGAAAGLGGSEADLTKGDVGGALKDTAKGAALGAAAGWAGGKLGKFVAGAPGRAEAAELSGLREGVQYSTKLKTFGKATPAAPEGQWTGNIRNAFKGAPEIKTAIEKDAPKALGLVDQKLDDIGGKLGDLYDKAAKASPRGIPLGAVTGRADEGQAVTSGLEKLEQEWGRTVANKPQAETVRSVIDQLEQRSAAGGLQSAPGHISVEDLHAEYRAWQDIANRANKVFSAKSPREEVAEDIANSLRESLQGHVEQVATANPALGISKQKLLDLNREYSTWSRVQKAVTEKATRAANNMTPMGDVVNGAAGALRHPLKFAAGAVSKGLGEAAAPADRALATVVKMAKAGNPKAVDTLYSIMHTGRGSQALPGLGGEAVNAGLRYATTPNVADDEDTVAAR